MEIHDDGSFTSTIGFSSGTILGGLLPKVFMYHTPYRVVSNQPRTPFWEILGALLSLTGLIFLMGDAETEQIRAGGQDLFVGTDRDMKLGHPMVPVSMFDSESGGQVFGSIQNLPSELEVQVRGTKHGEWVQRTMLPTMAVKVTGKAAHNRVDTVLLSGASSGFPQVRLSTQAQSSTAKVRMDILEDPSGRPARSWECDLRTAKDDVATMQIDPRDGSLLLSSAGGPGTVDIRYEHGPASAREVAILNNVVVGGGEEVMRVRPRVHGDTHRCADPRAPHPRGRSPGGHQAHEAQARLTDPTHRSGTPRPRGWRQALPEGGRVHGQEWGHLARG